VGTCLRVATITGRETFFISSGVKVAKIIDYTLNDDGFFRMYGQSVGDFGSCLPADICRGFIIAASSGRLLGRSIL
jgi:hypothetical protein